MRSILLIAILYFLSTDRIYSQTDNTNVQLDHITIAVSDLDKASDTFTNLGFTLKEGRLHSNGLLNRHIKFRDGSSVELITLNTSPSDDLSKTYSDFLNNGDGAIYLALSAPFDSVLKYVKELYMSFSLKDSQPFSYLTLEDKGANSFYFIKYQNLPSDADSVLNHSNNVVGIRAAWVRSSPIFTKLLRSLGATYNGFLRTPDGKENAVYLINGLRFIIDDTTLEESKILGVQFDSTDILPLTWLPPSENHGVWVTFR